MKTYYQIVFLFVCLFPQFSISQNMNGDYVLSPPNNKFPTQYANYPGKTEYFDVYSQPITTLYSQVYWTLQNPVDLPLDIVKRFEDKGMAIIGFEFDQVRRTSKGDVSVPMNVAYNHHFEADITGKYSRLKNVSAPPPGPHGTYNDFTNMGHKRPNEDFITVEENLLPSSPIPTYQRISAGNGGEARKSFHGYAPGYAQIINSPRQIHITPMQIDTWNRDFMNLTGSSFVSGPVPKHSLAPTHNSLYSGLLECPLTSRIEKLLKSDFYRSASKCQNKLNRITCQHYANGNFTTVDSEKYPSGCSGIMKDGSVDLVYNQYQNSSTKCGSNFTTLSGSANSLVNLTIKVASSVFITIEGPANVWFGIGFNATVMAQNPWTIIVSGNQVSEYILGNHNPGTKISPTVTVISSKVSGGKRTVVLRRNLSHPYFPMSLDMKEDVNIITAVGKSLNFSYHQNKTSAIISLFPVGSRFCVCEDTPPPFGKGTGFFVYENSTKVGFDNICLPEPRTDMLAQRNPTCDIRTYVGGQLTCHHLWYLLDKDQEIPWKDKPLTYHLKFRFWFQEYNSSYHQNVKRTAWGIASPVEYDVPACQKNQTTCIHKITGTFNPPSVSSDATSMKLIAGHFHCHAPTCLDITLYDNKTGEILCQEKPIYGNGTGRFGEPGYIAQPPCLWGHGYGLPEPIQVANRTLYVVKHSNNTYGHHGEMAWLQMFYV